MSEYEPSLQDLKTIYQNDLYAFAKHGLGYKDLTIQTHDPIASLLMGPSKKKLIVVPRGCFKSTLCSISYPIWLLINDFNHRILLDSELYSNSSKFLREIKGHLTSKHMTDLFGEFYSDVNWRDGELTIKQRTKVFKESSITCSGIGAQKTSQHYDTIIADDLNSLDNSQTPELREKVLSHFKMYISLLEPGGKLIVVATRYAEQDVVGYILDSENQDQKKTGLVY